MFVPLAKLIEVVQFVTLSDAVTLVINEPPWCKVFGLHVS